MANPLIQSRLRRTAATRPAQIPVETMQPMWASPAAYSALAARPAGQTAASDPPASPPAASAPASQTLMDRFEALPTPAKLALGAALGVGVTLGGMKIYEMAKGRSKSSSSGSKRGASARRNPTAAAAAPLPNPSKSSRKRSRRSKRRKSSSAAGSSSRRKSGSRRRRSSSGRSLFGMSMAARRNPVGAAG